MDTPTPSPGTPQQSGSRFSLSSWKSWWSLRWMPVLFSTRCVPPPSSSSLDSSPLLSDSTSAFVVDETSAPSSPLPANNTQSPGVPAAFTPSIVQQERKGISEGQRFVNAANIPPAAVPATTAVNFRSTAAAAVAATDAKMGRFHSADSSNGSSNNTGVAADSTRFGESSRSTTPRPLSPSATSTPRLSTPLMAPLSEEVYAVKPWAMMEAAAVATSARSTASFPLSGTTSAADALAADQMRIPPACVELPGPQSLFIRGTAASGCDSHSIGLLQRSVLAEQLAASLSRSQ